MSRWLNINDATVVSAARRQARQFALDIGLKPTRAEEVAIATSEAASNALRHGGGGRALIQKSTFDDKARLEVIVADEGQGISNLDAAMTDGVGKCGSAGLGLGAMQRLSDEFGVWSEPNLGTVASCSFETQPDARRQGPVRFAGLICCHPTESVCGDHWTARTKTSAIDILVCDGLGHGPAAAKEATDLAAAFSEETGAPGDALSHLSRRLTGRRGAVASAIRVNLHDRMLSYGGVGNVSTFLVRDGAVKRFAVRDGRIGGQPLTAFSETRKLKSGDVVVLHSDGLTTFRSNEYNMALFTKSPLIIAATLMHRNFRGRDDAGIAVLQID